jgi:fatty acid desaturase
MGGGAAARKQMMHTTRQSHEIPQALNAAVIALQLAAIATCLSLCRSASGWALFALAIVFGIVMNSVYSVIHEAEHRILFTTLWINETAGALMALFFPAPFHLLRQGHLGHHMRNRSDDEAFDLYFAEDNRLWKCCVLYGIVTGGYWLFVVAGNVAVLLLPFLYNEQYWHFDRASVAFLRAFNARDRHVIQAEAALAIALHAGIVTWLQIPLLRYAGMYAGFGLLWSAMQYVHHYGTQRDVLGGARNLWLGQPLDLLLLNHNWHRTHHENPTIPWTELPSHGEREKGLRGFLPWAYLKMWRGPTLTTERVENRYAGRIIV